MVIDGKKIANGIVARLKERPTPKKFLAIVLVGDDAASASFVKQKEKVARELGIDFRIARLSSSTNQETLVAEIGKLVRDEQCGGIVLQLPLPEHFDRDKIIAAIPPEKDVDNLRGDSLVLSPAAGVVQEILNFTHYSLPITAAAVVGHGFLVGQPIVGWLRGSANSHELADGRAKKVMVLDVGDDLAALKDADVVILGVGKAGLVTPAMLKPNALVIDFGYSRGPDGKLHGDFNASEIENWKLKIENLRYTPVPHGAGPILVAKLFENFYTLNR